MGSHPHSHHKKADTLKKVSVFWRKEWDSQGACITRDGLARAEGEASRYFAYTVIVAKQSLCKKRKVSFVAKSKKRKPFA